MAERVGASTFVQRATVLLHGWTLDGKGRTTAPRREEYGRARPAGSTASLAMTRWHPSNPPVYCPVSNVQSAPPPAFWVMTIGSIVHSSFMMLAVIVPAAPSEATPASARVP